MFEAQPSQPPASQPVLPAQYYLDHFDEFLAVIRERYRPVLQPEHEGFLDLFESLPRSARCLYVRLLNRRGRIFDTRRLRYAEIEHLPEQVAALVRVGLVRSLQKDDAADWFTVLSKQALLSLIVRQCSPGSYRRSWSKAALVEFALDNLNLNHPAIAEAMPAFVVQQGSERVGYLLFLYFGKFEQNLMRFTLRDLGVVRTNRFSGTAKPRFEDPEVAQSTWFYCRKLSEIEALEPTRYTEVAETLSAWPTPAGEQSNQLRQRAVYQLGEGIERYGDAELAEQVYRACDGWPASERRVRLLYARGDRDAARAILEGMLEDPDCDEELLFAEDFSARKFDRKRTSTLTDLLRNATELCVDESYRDIPERGAAALLAAEGWNVIHTENRVWKTLFGVLFWDLLFGEDGAAIYNDFEKRPVDLDTGAFYGNFREEIDAILGRLADTEQTLNRLLKSVATEYGKPNSVFVWRPDMLDEVRLLLQSAPAGGVQQILERLCQDYRGNRSGYPDLMVTRGDELRFIEIKAEGDQLRRNQLKQFTALKSAGFDVAVNRVRWVARPDQIYVVVDIETTGRRSAANRITEIAAVKMQCGEVIDEWQSLINPCRSIPSFITSLTGIDDSMVADAPLFSEIADELRAFTEGAVFVAHNVRFDYGFISDEYRRLEQTWHRPTLCSCVQMRKWYPGRKSYSLKNLCADFDISLDSHHRAMCDAKAASELLKLVNDRRFADNPD